MIKEIHVCQCDICGAVTEAKGREGRYNETFYVCPDGWTVGHNKDFHICPECSRKLGKDLNP